jgi:hypothetical protein
MSVGPTFRQEQRFIPMSAHEARKLARQLEMIADEFDTCMGKELEYVGDVHTADTQRRQRSRR